MDGRAGGRVVELIELEGVNRSSSTGPRKFFPKLRDSLQTRGKFTQPGKSEMISDLELDQECTCEPSFTFLVSHIILQKKPIS